MRLPGPTDRILLAAAFGAVVGSLLGRLGLGVVAGVLAVLLGLMGGMARPARRWVVLVAGAVSLAIAAGAGVISLASDASTMATVVTAELLDAPVTLRSDPLVTGRGWVARAESSDGVSILLSGDVETSAAAGDVVAVNGAVRDEGGRLRGRPYAGRVAVSSLEVVGTRPWFIVANRLRDRVTDGLTHYDSPGAALVSGFLIGDIRNLPAVHEENLRAAGLSHYVAVSGSNVAMFLGLWWLVTAPLASRPRWRALSGVVGVALFVLVTRWEPSVLRAAAMAVVVLVGRAAGVPLSGWGAWASAVAGLSVVDPTLVQEVGFQLSAAATLGLLVGAGMFRGHGPVWLAAPLGATIAAQLAVSPLLLWYFEEIPLFSPLTNLLAGPIVALSTATGGVGVLTGVDPLVRVGVGLGEIVVRIAGIAAGLPIVGWTTFGFVAVAGAGWRIARLRPFIAVGVGAVILTSVVTTIGGSGPRLVVFDVGQGDAVLLVGPAGERVLVDGGPDARVLARKLREYGVRTLDLVIITHGHADHVIGLESVFGVVSVGEVWWSPHDEPSAMDALVPTILAAGVPMTVPVPGTRYQLGGITLDVVGPVRRYASPNDASLVVVATVNGRTVTLAGEIEAFAEADLGPLEGDILKVPHHGAATSDEAWLRASASSVAIIPVGPNDFGHPVPWVIEALEEGGALVCRTDRDGDVVVPLDYSDPVASGC